MVALQQRKIGWGDSLAFKHSSGAAAILAGMTLAGALSVSAQAQTAAPGAPGATVLASAPPAPPLSVDAATLARVDAMLWSYADAQQFMGAVLVVKDGQILLDKAYGFRDIEKKIPNTPDTRFYIGSITKQFTAASILLLEERGKVSIDDPVGKYLSGLPATWADIPLKNLLTHTSGIPDYLSNMPKSAWAKPATNAQKLAVVRDKPLKFAPDTDYAYSNTNYILLGMVVEKAGVMPYAKFLQANLFKPLRMNATRCGVQLEDIKGYISLPGGLDVEPPAPYAFASDFADGCLV